MSENFGSFTAFSSLIISIAALVVAWNSHKTSKDSLEMNRKHQRMSCRPHLSSWLDTSEKNGEVTYTFDLKNNGLGPAVIKSFDVYAFNQKMTDNYPVAQALATIFSSVNLGQIDARTSRLVEGESIGVDDKVQLFQFTMKQGDEYPKLDWEGFLLNARIVIEYESFYEERMPAYDTEKYKPILIQKADPARTFP